jgi:Starch-binding associating with outer membrane/Susd and RagB outer membrane lipoprotein
MKNFNFLKYFVVSFLFFLSSCDTIDLDQIDNPSTPDVRLYDPVFGFNYIQLELASFVNETNGFTQQVMRQMAMGGNDYNDAFSPTSFNGHWTVGYGILNAVKFLEPKAREKNELFILGASKVIESYVLMTLVDVYGDIPYTEALNPNILNPKYDSSSSVYKAALTGLDNAIAILQSASSPNDKVTDLYYAKNKLYWITLAKTLKFKLLITAREAGSDLGVDISSSLNILLSENDLIDTAAEDFNFKYGKNRNVPNSRHPLYNDQYELGGGAYLGNYFIWAMTMEKNQAPDFDPRLGWYFFKQDLLDNKTSIQIPGRTRPVHYNNIDYNSFYSPGIRTCYTTSDWISPTTSTPPTTGYLGRDHANPAGIPPDAEIRSVAGVYPVGGSFGGQSGNANEIVQKSGTSGALGAGIMPIMMSSFVQFLKAEAILKIPGVLGDAKAELLGAITKSIDRVTTPIDNYPVLTTAILSNISNKKTAYLNFISAEYTSGTVDEKLEIIIKEYYLASWGNGLESYNNYRRTGYPSNLQPTLELNSGSFYYTAFYPQDASSSNPNTPPSLRTRKVFWDKANLTLR